MGLRAAEAGTSPLGDARNTEEPLFVDLDGTLVRTDTLHESFLKLVKSDPLRLAGAAVMLLRRGIAAFKQRVSSLAELRPELLPYNEEVLAYVRDEAARGRRIILTTAADARIAEGVARHLGLFDAVLASDGATNLKAEAKAARIREHLGEGSFEYIGNSAADVAIWREASSAAVVNPTRGVRQKIRQAGVRIAKEFPARRDTWAVARAMRVYQWSKNLLIFAPLLLSHKVFEWPRLLEVFGAFAAFCAAASAIYVINDLLDLEADRQHPRKRYRPFAAGAVSIADGAGLAAALVGTCIAISTTLPPLGGVLMALYVATSLLYGVYAKSHLFLDVITLSGLYTARLLVGGIAADVVLSPWTLGFSIFFFTSLASCKRLSELRTGRAGSRRPLPGRAYLHLDLFSLTALASSSGYAAVVVMALYLNSPEVVKLYRRPEVMWCLAPLVAYWISRMIMIANRGQMHDDPIVFAFGDRASQVVAAATLAVIAAAL